jgi:hypothetical protein
VLLSKGGCDRLFGLLCLVVKECSQESCRITAGSWKLTILLRDQKDGKRGVLYGGIEAMAPLSDDLHCIFIYLRLHTITGTLMRLSWSSVIKMAMGVTLHHGQDQVSRITGCFIAGQVDLARPIEP